MGKKLMSFILVFVMTLSLAVPAFAAEIVMPIPPVIDAEDFVTASGTFTEIDQLGNATYYIQKTDEYTVAIGLYPNVVDCSIKYNTTNLISSAIIPIENVNSIIPQTRNGSKSAQFETIKEAPVRVLLFAFPDHLPAAAGPSGGKRGSRRSRSWRSAVPRPLPSRTI